MRATDPDLELLGINVIRGLAMDAPTAAKSGHPGTAMALAPLAHVLFTRVMRHDPSQPDWPDRDRFVLSAGHASILLYSMLHLTGYGLELDDLRGFRTFGSPTPGHPEVHHTAGVEVTTGPLGQGFGNGVGMGLAERYLRSRFGADVCDHHTFVICGDGDLQEGISHEAASLAGHLGLGRLVYVYDDNHITIDGPTEIAYSDDVPARFRSYGWHVEDLGEVANDLDALEAGLRLGMAEEERPTLLVLRSHIGWPSPTRVDTPKAHGDPFTAEEITETKAILGLPDEPFHVPPEVLDMYRQCIERGRDLRSAWEKRLASWNGDRAAYDACLGATGLPGWQSKLPVFDVGASLATRVASGKTLEALLDVVPALVAGGADLTGNTGTTVKDRGVQSTAEPAGRQVYFGIREHAMGAAMNGMAAHGGVVPVGGTFFVFSDYMRPAVRLAAMGEAKGVFVWTHDSIGLGQDGPTHQPIEHLAALRAMPGLRLIRPADANETAHAWRVAIESTGPTGLVLSRQNVPVMEGTAEAFDGVARGAYTLVEPGDGAARVVLVGTGAEVHVCVGAAEVLAAGGVSARVVSMPSWDLFAAQDQSYRDSVFTPGVPRLGVEAASPFGWERWVDDVVGLPHFGASAPGEELLDRFGYTPDNVAARAMRLISGKGS